MRDGESAAVPWAHGRATAPDEAHLLDLELDAIFGKGFSRVVEHHFRDIAGEGLWRALVAGP